MSDLPQGWAVVEDDAEAAPPDLPAGWAVVPEPPGVLARAANAVKEFMTKPADPMQSLQGQGLPSAGADSFGQPDDSTPSPRLQEAALRLGIPLAAGALAPVTGGASIPLGVAALGGLTGEILAQQSEMQRGAREQAGYGRMAMAPVVAALPLGPASATSVRAFDSAGNLLAVAPQAVLKRALFGGTINAGASVAEQAIDSNSPAPGWKVVGSGIDWGEVASSAAFGAIFGGALGGLETVQRTRAGKEEILQLRKATGHWQDSDMDFLKWVKTEARASTGPNAPAEEGAPVPEGQNPGLPEGYTEVAPAPADDISTQGSSVVEQRPHTAEAAGSTPAPAPILPEAPAEPVEPANMPQWARDEMLARGLDPARPLNDIDIAQPSIQQAVQSDPTLTPEQKDNILNSGSPNPITTGTPAQENAALNPTPVADANAEVLSSTGRTGMVFPDKQSAQTNIEPGQEVRPAGGGSYEIYNKTPQLPAAPPALEPPAQATVTPTPAGPVVAPKPAEDKRVSQLADPKQLRVQKEFLVSAFQGAVKAAPETAKISAAGLADIAKMQSPAGLREVAVAYGIDPEGKRDPKIGLSLDQAVALAIRSKHADHVTIEVPGDGTFRVPNSKAQLKAVAANIEKRFGKSTAKPRLPSPNSERTITNSASEPGTIVAVKKNPTPADLGAAAKLAAAADEDRVTQHVFSDSGYAIATDGRRMFVVAGGAGKTQAEITAITIKATGVKSEDAVSKYPNWRQVWPKWVRLVGGKIHVSGAPATKFILDTGDTIKAMKQAQAVVGDKSNSVGIFKVSNGKLGFEAHSPDLGDYRTDGVNDTDQAISSLNPQFLKEAMLAARLAGHDKVTVYITDEIAPVVVVGGDNFAALTMPTKLSGTRLAGSMFGTPFNKPAPKPSGIAYQPGYGPNAKPAPVAVTPPAAAAPAPLPATPADIPDWASKPIAAQTVAQPNLMETPASRAPLLARIRQKIANLEKLRAEVDETNLFPSSMVQHMERVATDVAERLERVEKRKDELERKEITGRPDLTKAEETELNDLRDKYDALYESNEKAEGDLKAVTEDQGETGLELIDSWLKEWQRRLGVVEAARLKAAQSGTLDQTSAGFTPRSGGRSAASPGHAFPPPMGAPAAPPIPPGPTMLRPVDNPDYSQLPIQLPEMVQFFRLLSGGQNPRVVEKIKTLRGTALGVFRYKEGDVDSGRIELRADLFHLLSQAEKDALMQKAVAWAKLMTEANPDMDLGEAIRHKFQELVKAAEAEAMQRDPARALAVFAHEIGHWIDFLPDGTLKRGNILGHIATLKHYLAGYISDHPDLFPWPLTEADKARLHRQAEKDVLATVQQITETITREEPIYKVSGLTAKAITEIVGQTAREDFPEFYDWFARLSRAEKVDLLKKAMKGIVDERAAKFGKREQVGTKTITEEVTRTVGDASPEAIAKRFMELLRAELKARGLISMADIKRELEGAIAWWNKREKMPAYFKTGVEMFAETFSILMNNPQALQARAPTFWRLFQNYLHKKPAVQKLYNQVQNNIKSGAIYAQRVSNLRGSWVQDEADGLTRELAGEKIPWRQYKDSLNLLFNKQQGPIQRLAAQQLGKPEANRLLGALKDYLYRQTAVEGLARQINIRVEAPLARNNLTHADLSEFMFHNRIVAGDAVQTANSQGWSPNTSAQRLKEMAEQLGPERFGALVRAASELRAIYEEGPVKLLLASRTLTPEMAKKIQENIAYSPFNKAREAFNPLDEGTIRGMLEASYGPAATARIFRRIGYLGDIQSPYLALVKKAESLTRFAYKQMALKSIRDFMLEYASDQIVQAPMVYNGTKLVPKDVDSPTVGTLYTLDDGKIMGWYVPRAIFETMEHASGTEQMMLGAALKLLSWPKAILTELNFGFWPVNFARDLGSFAVQMKGGIGGLKRLPQAYAAARATLTSKPNPIADQLLSRLMVISRADPRGEHLGHPDEMDRWLLRMNKHPELWDAQTKKMGLLLRAWEAYKAQGQILERTTKALGMMLLDAQTGTPAPLPNLQWVTMPEWMKKNIVNELAGSPDFNERGRGIAFVEVAGGPIFANAWLRGIESFYKAQKRDPAGVWAKFLLAFGLPALAFYAYEKGWTNLGVDPVKAEDERAMLRSIPERDKLRGFVKTLGWVDKAQGKVAYIVLPFPEQVRTLHALWRKLLQSMGGDQGRKLGAASMINYQGQDLPGQNPLISEALKWWDFAAVGHNPYDSFRGRNVIDDKTFAAGQGAGQLARQTVANLSGNIIPQPAQQTPGEKPTDVEKFLHQPLVSDLLGRWVRVSNAGLAEQDQAVLQPVAERRAQLQIAGDEMLRKLTSGEKWTENEFHLMADSPYLTTYMLGRFQGYAAGAAGPEIRDFMKANNEERAALLKLWMDRTKAKNARLEAAGVNHP